MSIRVDVVAAAAVGILDTAATHCGGDEIIAIVAACETVIVDHADVWFPEGTAITRHTA